jgi:N-acyl-D-aspartate/D-glutamate deacylase
MARRNEGFAQQTLVSNDPLDDMAHLEELAEVSGRPVIWNVLVGDAAEPGRHRMAIAWFDSCRERGLPLYCQAITCDTSAAFTLDVWNLWDANPAWQRALTGDAAERMRKLSDPAVRAELRQENIVLYPLRLTTLTRTELPEYKKYEGMTVTRIATELDVHPVDALLDICVAEGLRTHWKAPVLEPANSVIRELIQSPWVIPGVSDGGAHSKMMTTGRYPTEHIETYVREYGWVTLEEMHWKLSAFPAWVAGFRNRGTITNGAPADIVVYDYDSLRALPDEIVHDLPGADWRRYCRAEGYRSIIVNGEVTFTDGKCTGVTPGRLLRHGG